ncbi:hypothetical protein NPIL_430551, partial [Nephila pilipes]
MDNKPRAFQDSDDKHNGESRCGLFLMETAEKFSAPNDRK